MKSKKETYLNQKIKQKLPNNIRFLMTACRIIGRLFSFINYTIELYKSFVNKNAKRFVVVHSTLRLNKIN